MSIKEMNAYIASFIIKLGYGKKNNLIFQSSKLRFKDFSLSLYGYMEEIWEKFLISTGEQEINNKDVNKIDRNNI
jgi:hypothetical protein